MHRHADYTIPSPLRIAPQKLITHKAQKIQDRAEDQCLSLGNLRVYELFTPVCGILLSSSLSDVFSEYAAGIYITKVDPFPSLSNNLEWKRGPFSFLAK
jgi:hypothetical protein